MNWIQDWWSFDWRSCPSPRYFRYSDFQNWPGCCSRTSLSSWVMVLIKIILHVIIDKRIKFRQELTQLRHINVPPKIINFSHGRRYWTGKDILTNFTFFTDFSEFLLLFISTNIINSMFSNVGKVILGFLIIVNTRNHNLIVGEILVTVQTLADSLKICLMVGFFWLLRVQSKSPLLTLTSNSSSNDLLKERKLVLEPVAKLISPPEVESSWSLESKVLRNYDPSSRFWISLNSCRDRKSLRCLFKRWCLVNLLLLMTMLNHCLN